MRKTKEEAAATRRRIVESAAVEFQRLGIDGSGLTGLMAAAGLTQGGFYKHFSSKAQLVAESTEASVDNIIDNLQGLLPDVAEEEGFDALVRGYLSQQHRDGDAGCPYAGVGSELARADESTRGVAVEGFERMVDLLSQQLVDQDETSRRERSLLTMCAMMGALTVSRMAQGNELADEVLGVAGKLLTQCSS
ncbi:TetR/AcrR family transcriptional regulator [Pseudomonas sp. NPDC090203]|uniref:TetR/AcrR family transcriptional regulator n=1 Tax=Pseudomonas sp. NPDC090203 TaxID=3364477 RepID=UPI0038138DBA